MIFKIISLFFYIAVVIINSILGLKFLLAKSFFTYHKEVAGMNWENVDAGIQKVILAVFKIYAAGWLSTALGILLFSVIPLGIFNFKWANYCAFSIGILFWIISLITVIYVKSMTGANTPMVGSLLAIIFLCIAFLFGLFIK